MRRQAQLRSQRGASLILVAVCAILLIALLYIAFQFLLVNGGSREVRNAVDAAALNLSKRAVEIKVGTAPLYKDCADSTGAVGMSNINRIWGKAMLINANEADMTQTGQSTPQAHSNADSAYMSAQQINDNLHGRLSSKMTMDPFFNSLAANRSAKLLGQGASIGATAADDTTGWSTAMVDRGAGSNLSFVKNQVPGNVTPPQAGKYISGYNPFQINGRSFCFAAFRSGEMPHLISDGYFGGNKGGLPANPIPNAFKETGVVSNGSTSLSASACAVSNPMRSFKLAIPHAYIAIVIDNTALWYVEGKFVKQTKYGTTPETQWGVKSYPLTPPPSGPGGLLDGYAELGDEYRAGNVWLAINSLPGDHTPALNKMVQRMQEVQPEFSLNDLKALLWRAQLVPDVQQYYIYPVYTTPDYTNPTITISPSNGDLPPWLQPQGADGQDKPVVKELMKEDEPNFCWENIVGGKRATGAHHTECSGVLSWQPGTGFGQCLGRLLCARLTQAFFSGD